MVCVLSASVYIKSVNQHVSKTTLILKCARGGKIVPTRPADISLVGLLSLKYIWAFYTVFFFFFFFFFFCITSTSYKSVMLLLSCSEDMKTFLLCWDPRLCYFIVWTRVFIPKSWGCGGGQNLEK